MPFSGSSFGLWNDVDLTSAFSGTLSLVNYTDLSDNPQDFVLYLGSPIAGRVLEASSNPGVDDIVLTPTDITPIWETASVYTLGKIIQPTISNGLVYKCTVAGTSDASEPSWPTSGIGSTVVDGTCIWALYAAHHPTTEIKLAITSPGLDSATGGVALSIGTAVDSEAANYIPIYIRVANSVTTVSNNTGNEEIGIYINSVVELGTV